MKKPILNNYVSLRELRENLPEYEAAVAKGRSFTVFKRSRPVFQISPVSDEGNWETVADFTSINPDGVEIDAVLKQL